MFNRTALLVLAAVVLIVGGLLVWPQLFDERGLVAQTANLSYAHDRVIVKMRGAAPPDAALLQRNSARAARQLFATHNARGLARTVMENAGIHRLYVVEVADRADPAALVRSLSGEPGVEYATLDYQVAAVALPNDPSFPTQQWDLHNTGQSGGTPDADIDAPEAWDIATGSANGPVVGVIDSGIDYNHPDLAANMWRNPGEVAGNGIDDDRNGYVDDVYGYDFANNDSNPMDDNSHGTHCAGTIAAVGNNGIGVAGVSWTGRVAALKFLDAGGIGYMSRATQALNYATMMGMRITSNSYGSASSHYAPMQDAITAANNAGNLFVAAAGNNSVNNDVTSFYPASYTQANVISVAATDRYDNLASYSNYGATGVDIGAPGTTIYSTTPNGAYGWKSGTSMAAPHVAGAAALLWVASPSLTHGQVKARLLANASPLPSLQGKVVSGGRLNLRAAIDNAAGGSSSAASSAPVASSVSSLAASVSSAASSVASSAPADTTPPVVTITKPFNGITLAAKGTTQVAASATDSGGVAEIKMYLDGALRTTCTLATSCSFSLNNNKTPAGSHTLSAVAKDRAGNTATASIVVVK